MRTVSKIASTLMAKAGNAFTVAELVKAPFKIGRKFAHHLWVNPRHIGYNATGLPTVPGHTVGYVNRPAVGLWVRLVRDKGNLRAVAVSGLTQFGFAKQSGQKPGEYWPPSGYMADVAVGPAAHTMPQSLAQAVIGTVVRIRDDQSMKTPALNKTEQLLRRSASIRADNSGVGLIFLGDYALINLGSKWFTYDIVP